MSACSGQPALQSKKDVLGSLLLSNVLLLNTSAEDPQFPEWAEGESSWKRQIILVFCPGVNRYGCHTQLQSSWSGRLELGSFSIWPGGLELGSLIPGQDG